MSPILGIFASSMLGAVGDYESIATTTLGSASSSVTFSSIASTYSHLQIRVLAKSNSSQSQLDLTINSSATGYAYHSLFGNGSTAGAEGSGSMTKIPAGSVAPSSATSTFSAFVIDILDYANTNKNKTIRTLMGFDTNGAGSMYLNSGLWANTDAISSITLTCRDFSFPQYSSFALYGIK